MPISSTLIILNTKNPLVFTKTLLKVILLNPRHNHSYAQGHLVFNGPKHPGQVIIVKNAYRSLIERIGFSAYSMSKNVTLKNR